MQVSDAQRNRDAGVPLRSIGIKCWSNSGLCLWNNPSIF